MTRIVHLVFIPSIFSRSEYFSRIIFWFSVAVPAYLNYVRMDKISKWPDIRQDTKYINRSDLWAIHNVKCFIRSNKEIRIWGLPSNRILVMLRIRIRGPNWLWAVGTFPGNDPIGSGYLVLDPGLEKSGSKISSHRQSYHDFMWAKLKKK